MIENTVDIYKGIFKKERAEMKDNNFQLRRECFSNKFLFLECCKKSGLEVSQ